MTASDTPQPQALRASADRVLALHDDGRLEDALAACEQLLTDLAGVLDAAPDADRLLASDPVIRETLFAARFERALLLTELGELEEATPAYRLAAATPADLDDPDQRHEVAMALLNAGVCADACGDPAAALDAYDELAATFGDATDPVTRDQVVRGRVNRAATLLAVDRPHEALVVADALVAELDPMDALQAEQLAMTARLRSAALRELDRLADAVDTLAIVDGLNDDQPGARCQVAAAQRERAELLAGLGRADEAMAVLDRALARFAGEPDPGVVEVLDDLRCARDALQG